MIPNGNDPRWKDLVQGKINYAFKAVAASMMLARLQRQLKAGNQNLDDAVKEATVFFTKYEDVFAQDLKAIFP